MIRRPRVAIALGSNLGNRMLHLRAATLRICEEFLDEVMCSRVYETEPWGMIEQPRFLNAVICGFCEWKPPAILTFLKQLEKELGRTPRARNHPREIDLDLIAWGEMTWSSDGLEVPHPGVIEREFVLVPFCEIWPDWRHPILKKTARTLKENCLDTRPQPSIFGGALLPDKESQ